MASSSPPSPQSSPSSTAPQEDDEEGRANMRTTTSKRRKAALLAALRALGLFLLLRFLLVHVTIVYLALLGGGSSGGGAGGGEQVAAPAAESDDAAVSSVAKETKKKNKNRKEEESRRPPPPPPEPIIKTVTKKVVRRRKADGLTPDQVAQLEAELESYVPTEYGALLPDADDGDGNANANRSSRITETISTLENLASFLQTDAIPSSVQSSSELQSELDEAERIFRELDERLDEQGGGEEEEDMAAMQRKKYGALLPELSALLGVNSYVDWDDDALRTNFASAMQDIGGSDGPLLGDAGELFRTALGQDNIVTRTDSAAEEEEQEKACDPAFLIRDAPKIEATTTTTEDENNKVVTTTDLSDVARESHLFSLVGSIESILRDRTGRYSGLLTDLSASSDSSNDDDDPSSSSSAGAEWGVPPSDQSSNLEMGTVGPLSTEAGLARFKKVIHSRAGSARIAVHREKSKLDEEIRVLEEVEVAEKEDERLRREERRKELRMMREADMEGGGGGGGMCVSEEDVEYMLDEGLEALLRNRDLTRELVAALQKLHDDKKKQKDEAGGGGEEGEDDEDEFDASAIDWTEGIDGEEGAVGGGRSRSASAGLMGNPTTDSSYAHRNTLRSLAETPLFPALMEHIDKLADAVGGYNDRVDDLIDFLAGDEAEGGSLGRTVGAALLEVLGTVRIPPGVRGLGEKPGLLRNGV